MCNTYSYDTADQRQIKQLINTNMHMADSKNRKTGVGTKDKAAITQLFERSVI